FTYSQSADLEANTGGSDFTTLHAVGGRIGFWLPEVGLMGGISGYNNGPYSTLAKDGFALWDIDLSYRRGDWDLRLEIAENHQQASSFIGNSIRRQGIYLQAAYRPYQCEHIILRNFEVAVRFSAVRFHGIDPTRIDPTAFASPQDVPVNRNQ